jgi:creatinine amidohydrolase
MNPALKEAMMLLENMSWQMVEQYLRHDDRIVLVMGATEEHGPNTLATDTQCPWEIAKLACEHKGVIVAPALPFGPSSFSLDYPGTISLTAHTYLSMIKDILDSVVRSGFKRVLIFSGHGGNVLCKNVIKEYVIDRSDLTLKFREWYMMPKTYAYIMGKGSTAHDHASWLESFPGINQPAPIAAAFKEQTYIEDGYALSAAETRASMGDGVASGAYTQTDEVMKEFFALAVNELEDFLDNGWTKTQRVPIP